MSQVTEPVGAGLRRRAPRWRPRSVGAGQWPVLGVISCGGVVGALTRYGVQLVWPYRASGFPWSTFTINVTGCLLIGVVMALVVDVWTGRRLLRPFLGVGVLGGYTSFSAYTLDVGQTLADDAPRVAVAYLVATVLAALVAVWAASTGTQLLLRRPWRRRRGRAR
ncbi:MAG: fluoride efflux transporter CrcB [Pseudonocardiaceae bacterium]|nr:fluoride efflux transporter CrcB [Pseudonocardiaceae bacterium]